MNSTVKQIKTQHNNFLKKVQILTYPNEIGDRIEAWPTIDPHCR